MRRNGLNVPILCIVTYICVHVHVNVSSSRLTVSGNYAGVGVLSRLFTSCIWNREPKSIRRRTFWEKKDPEIWKFLRVNVTLQCSHLVKGKVVITKPVRERAISIGTVPIDNEAIRVCVVLPHSEVLPTCFYPWKEARSRWDFVPRNEGRNRQLSSRYRRRRCQQLQGTRKPLTIQYQSLQHVVLSEEGRQQCLQSNFHNQLLQTIQLYVARHDHARRSQAELPKGMRSPITIC
jgi:hypothetical protein